MKNLQYSIISAFTDNKDYKGNTTAVVHVTVPLKSEEMQEYARILNQPATTFIYHDEFNEEYHLRWFAPDAEIDLCGHGSFGAIPFLLDEPGKVELNFAGGIINGEKYLNNECSIDLDTIESERDQPPKGLEDALGVKIESYFKTNNKHIVVLESERKVAKMKPDFEQLKKIKVFGYAVTAPGDEVDFVSRTIVPHVQALEDQATGSSHAALFPFWAKNLKKESLTAIQVSQRGGFFKGEVNDGRVLIRSGYRLYSEGNLKEL
ncbi:PhzF family phenazine biosynthesis protein [Marinigracilibium pacificum]|uniref:PhzF family phenazine biosynthesis protein n=1 Tax=Marinigracilibium pacificum TaxID=2729599 RepID=A0A848IYB0_9BACT|nr:PhzF family phenazine biosynthesis protein [Marinigracilibium pacificum]NMM48158.1 PhzF family phenazine biosynthesis protein [Marinigracilibium pacificum]